MVAMAIWCHLIKKIFYHFVLDKEILKVTKNQLFILVGETVMDV